MMPGVVGVLTAKDVKGTNRLKYVSRRPPDTVRGQGALHRRPGGRRRRPHPEPGSGGRRGREGEYELLPVIDTFEKALAADAVQVHADRPNVSFRQPVLKGDAEKAFADSAVVVEARFRHADQPPGSFGAGTGRRVPRRRGRGRSAGRDRTQHQHPQALADAARRYRLGEHALRGGLLRGPVRHQAGHHLRGHSGRGCIALPTPSALHTQSDRGHADDLQAARLRHAGQAGRRRSGPPHCLQEPLRGRQRRILVQQ